MKFWRYEAWKEDLTKLNTCLKCDGNCIKHEFRNDVEHSIKREVLYDGLLDEQVTLEELRLTIISRLPDGNAPGAGCIKGV